MPNNGYVPTDLMFGDPDWMKWSLRGGEVGSEYKGPDRHVMIAHNAQVTNGFKAGLLNRETNELHQQRSQTRLLNCC